MRKQQIALQYMHYKDAGFDLLAIKHSGKTIFANPDVHPAKSWRVQRVMPSASRGSKNVSASR